MWELYAFWAKSRPIHSNLYPCINCKSHWDRAGKKVSTSGTLQYGACELSKEKFQRGLKKMGYSWSGSLFIIHTLGSDSEKGWKQCPFWPGVARRCLRWMPSRHHLTLESLRKLPRRWKQAKRRQVPKLKSWRHHLPSQSWRRRRTSDLSWGMGSQLTFDKATAYRGVSSWGVHVSSTCM